jgi:putative nucleotidyltransferase with HDIG domain
MRAGTGYTGAMSLKLIPVAHVTRGMFLDGFEGSWFEHDLWKTRFLIEDDATLERVRNSGARHVWIDVSRGIDVAETPVAVPAPVGQLPDAGAATVRASTLDDELRNAAVIRERSRAVMAGLYTDARMGNSIDIGRCAPVVDDVVGSIHRNGDALVSLVRLKTADDYTYMHSVAVCALMVSLGRQSGMSDAECREAGLAGLLHDIGKVSIPLEILNKPGKLTDAEYEVMRQHPASGWQLLREAGVGSEPVLDVVRHHHERFDGDGYPDRLHGAALSPIARMGAICDVYDAITSNRPYKRAWDPAASIAQMASWKGQFDPDLLKAFIRAVGIYPTGSLVCLESGKLAVVLEQNPQRLTSPRVKVFFSTSSMLALRPAVVDLAAPSVRDRIESRESPEKWRFGYLHSLWAGDSEIALALDDEVGRRNCG